MKKILVFLMLMFLASSAFAGDVNYLYADYNWDNSPHNYNNSLNNPKAQIFYSTKDKPKGYIVKNGNKFILFDFKGNCKGYIKERGKL